MNGLWCYFLKRWSPEYCQDILDRTKKIDFQNGVVGNSVYDEKIRRSRIKFLQSSDPLFKDVFNDLWIMALDANKTFFNFHLTKLDFIQLTEYKAEYQGEYKKHHDVFWVNNDPIYHRKLSCTIQLSSPNSYEGGEMSLEDIDSELPKAEDVRQQGTVLFFPSFIPHKVNPVTRGTRYSLVAWFDGPKWR